MQKNYRLSRTKIAGIGKCTHFVNLPTLKRIQMLIRKTAKPCLRLTLTVGLAASVSLMSVFLHQPSMAKVLSAVPYESTQKKSTRKSLLTTAKLLSVSNHSSSPLLARNERPGEGPGVRFSPLLAKDERRKVRDQMGVRRGILPPGLGVRGRGEFKILYRRQR